MSNMKIAVLSLLVVTWAAGCGNGDGGATAGTAAPGTGAAAPGTGAAAPGTGAAAPGTGAAAAPAGGGKLVHQTGSKDECSFEFDAPEKLEESEKDGMSFTLKSASFSFAGFAGSSLYGIDQLKDLSLMGGKDELVVSETANGINLVITRFPTPSDPLAAVTGHGEEAETKGRRLGCSFLCRGVKEREADVVAMCKSARIKYDASKAAE